MRRNEVGTWGEKISRVRFEERRGVEWWLRREEGWCGGWEEKRGGLGVEEKTGTVWLGLGVKERRGLWWGVKEVMWRAEERSGGLECKGKMIDVVGNWRENRGEGLRREEEWVGVEKRRRVEWGFDRRAAAMA